MTKYQGMLIGWVVLGLLAALWWAGERWGVERNNRRVELVADYREIVDLSTDTGQPLATVLQRLREAGLTSVAVSEETLTQLVNEGQVEVAGEVHAQPRFLGPQDRPNLFLFFADKNRFERILGQLQQKYGPDLVTPLTRTQQGAPQDAEAPPEKEPPGGKATLEPPPWALRVQDEQIHLNQVGLGLPWDQLRRVRKAGLRVVARLRNYPGLTPQAAGYMLQQVRKEKVQTVIFLGDEVLGFRDLIPSVAAAMREESLHWGLIEFARQRGETPLARALDGAVVRVHSITEQEVLNYSPVRAVERFARAARERNIRLCFVRLFMGPQEDKLGANEAYLRLLDRHLRRACLVPGPAQSFDPLEAPWSGLALMGMGVWAALLLALEARGLVSTRTGKALLFLGALITVAGLAISPSLYRKLAALGAGILFPTGAGAYAFRAVRQRMGFSSVENGEGWSHQGTVLGALKRATGVLWGATLLTLVGAVFVVGLLADRAFLVKIDQFTGVKLAHLMPFLLLGGLVLGRLLEGDKGGPEVWSRAEKRIADWVRQPLLLSHAILAGAILLGLAVLLLRSGNAGLEPSALEMKFRDVLERVLFVRPRTKEFLLGHPLFFLGAAMAFRGRPKWLLPCLFLGMVGQVSTLNTFCHLHTPLSISLLRTFHALWLGTLGGAILTLLVLRIESRR